MSNFPTSGQVKSEGVQYGMILYNRDLRDYFHKGQTVLAGTELPFQDVQKRYVGKRVAKGNQCNEVFSYSRASCRRIPQWRLERII